MTDRGNLPPEMWDALLRIEGSTGRTEAKLDGAIRDIGDVKGRVSSLELAHGETRSNVDKIVSERSTMVPDFKTLIDRVGNLEQSRAKVEAGVSTIKFIFGGQLIAIVGGVLALYNAQPASAPQGAGSGYNHGGGADGAGTH